MDDISDAWDLVVTLLDDGESEDGQVHGDDASTDGLALALTGTAGTVTGVTVGEEKADTGWVHDSLLHWETLLVVASGDLEDVSLELVSNAVTWDLGAHSLVHEDTELTLIFDFDKLLTAIGRLYLLLVSCSHGMFVRSQISRAGGR